MLEAAAIRLGVFYEEQRLKKKSHTMQAVTGHDDIKVWSLDGASLTATQCKRPSKQSANPAKDIHGGMFCVWSSKGVPN